MDRRTLLQAAAAAGVGGDAAPLVMLAVKEGAGLRRFGYPVVAPLRFDRGEVTDARLLELVDPAGNGIATEWAVAERWPDGSLRRASACFNLSLGPNETALLSVRRRSEPAPEPQGPRAEENATAWQLLAYRIPKSGPVLVESIRYALGEFLRADGLRLYAIATTGERLAAETRSVRLLRAGPLHPAVELTGVYRAPSAEIPWRATIECPNSKSWLAIVHRLEDARGPIAAVGLTIPYAFERAPARVDFGCGSWVYAPLRAGESLRLRCERGRWEMALGRPDRLAPYARASSVQPRFEGWGHLIDGVPGGRAIAFGSTEWATGRAGEIVITSDGRLTASWAASHPRYTFAAHHVADPVQVTAATGPVAMLSPLTVRAIRRR